MSRFIIIAGLLSVCLVFGYLLVWPKYQEIAKLRQELAFKEEVLASKEDYLFRLKSAETELEKYQEMVDKVNYALPQKADIPEVLDFLEDAFTSNGLLLTKIQATSRPKPQRAADGGEQQVIMETELFFGVTGPLQSLISFFSRLENSARLFDIRSIAMEREIVSNRPKTGNLNFEVSLAVRSWDEDSFRIMPPIQPRSTDLNLAVLKRPEIEELEIFRQAEIPEDYGRDNPFIPYVPSAERSQPEAEE